MWTNCSEEGAVISRYTVFKSADLFINDSRHRTLFRRCWRWSALCFFYAGNNITGTVWYRCPKNGILKLNLLRVLCEPVVCAGENEPMMSGKHYKGQEVSCCIKYFIFGFNIIFWVSALCVHHHFFVCIIVSLCHCAWIYEYIHLMYEYFAGRSIHFLCSVCLKCEKPVCTVQDSHNLSMKLRPIDYSTLSRQQDPLVLFRVNVTNVNITNFFAIASISDVHDSSRVKCVLQIIGFLCEAMHRPSQLTKICFANVPFKFWKRYFWMLSLRFSKSPVF